ncbi:glutathione synthase/RimK-type ligase-like ATP-grasp enzyme [Paenibacillus harenae]|uniref:Glutathione synthase/RimK-type ligase-like ATP-grasp enzyme n=2 Tax=Paenibacillus harenae TaxID=306543 RepID=A0ABT9U938_PAEHA|nr:glutathione synthase/RimK-type ligase-like ATP-grasp enzyme [Paenibacillus harenae]
MQMIVIGNPGNRRTAGIQSARAKLGLPPAYEVRYLDLLQRKTSLTESVHRLGLKTEEPLLLRLDAPGEHFDVERELIALGAPDVEPDKFGSLHRSADFPEAAVVQPLSRRMALALQEHKGKLYHPSQWFRGYCRLLAELDGEAKQLWQRPGWMNAPMDIAAMFDKRQTHKVLTSAGVPVPKLLSPPDAIPDYETLRSIMKQRRMNRIFAKLAFGSGACGVIAYQTNPTTGAEVAVTTIGVDNFIAKPPIYYNVKKLVRYTDSRMIRQIVNWLLRHGAHIEQWIPKASYDGQSFDIRQLVVAGQSCHSAARVSRTPITNLHLRSERKSLNEVGLTASEENEIRSCAERALEAFPESTIAGIDIALSAGSRRPFVLDVNPYGDLLYHIRHEGYDPYEWEMKQLAGP